MPCIVNEYVYEYVHMPRRDRRILTISVPRRKLPGLSISQVTKSNLISTAFKVLFSLP